MILRSTIYPGWEHLATRPEAHGRSQWDWPITSEVGVLRTCNLLDQIGNVFLFQIDPIFNVDFMYWWKSWHFVWFPVIHWIYLLELDFYNFFSLPKSKESQATHVLSKPNRSVSILFGITTKVFKSPMSGAGSNVLLDTPHDHSTIQLAFNCCFYCSFYVQTYFFIFYLVPLGSSEAMSLWWMAEINSFRTVLTRYSEDLPPSTVIEVWNLTPLDVFWLQKPSNQMKKRVSGWIRWRIHQHDWVHIFPDWHDAFFLLQVYQREHQLTYTFFVW